MITQAEMKNVLELWAEYLQQTTFSIIRFATPLS